MFRTSVIYMKHAVELHLLMWCNVDYSWCGFADCQTGASGRRSEDWSGGNVCSHRSSFTSDPNKSRLTGSKCQMQVVNLCLLPVASYPAIGCITRLYCTNVCCQIDSAENKFIHWAEKGASESRQHSGLLFPWQFVYQWVFMCKSGCTSNKTQRQQESLER